MTKLSKQPFFFVQVDEVCCTKCRQHSRVNVEQTLMGRWSQYGPLKRSFSFQCGLCGYEYLYVEQQFPNEHIGDVAVNYNAGQQIPKEKEMIDDSKLEQAGTAATSLGSLLMNPHPGLSTWCEAVGRTKEYLDRAFDSMVEKNVTQPCSRCDLADKVIKALDYAQAAPNTNGLLSIDEAEAEGREQDIRWKFFQDVRERYEAAVNVPRKQHDTEINVQTMETRTAGDTERIIKSFSAEQLALVADIIEGGIGDPIADHIFELDKKNRPGIYIDAEKEEQIMLERKEKNRIQHRS